MQQSELQLFEKYIDQTLSMVKIPISLAVDLGSCWRRRGKSSKTDRLINITTIEYTCHLEQNRTHHKLYHLSSLGSFTPNYWLWTQITICLQHRLIIPQHLPQHLPHHGTSTQGSSDSNAPKGRPHHIHHPQLLHRS